MSDRRVRQRVAVGELKAYKKRGSWRVEEWTVYEDLAIPKHGAGRRLDPATAWGVVAVLAGIELTWLSASQRCRVRRRVARSAPVQLAAAVGPVLDFTERPSLDRELLGIAIAFRIAVSPYVEDRRRGLVKLAVILGVRRQRDDGYARNSHRAETGAP